MVDVTSVGPDSGDQKSYRLAERFEIGEVIGTGGMGKVLKATDRSTGNVVALKILHEQIASDPQQARRFQREVELALKVQHRNSVQLVESGQDAAGIQYLIMEYVQGRTLKAVLEAGPMPWRAAVTLLVQVCAGLDAIHGSGIIHRDLKPSNIIVTADEVVKIMDFGVARERASDLTRTNEIVGSIGYMAPELWKGNEGEPTTSVDIYALGVLAYELLTGLLPFDGETPAELMWKHLELAPTPPRDVVPEIPRWLNQIILKMLEKRLYDRPGSAAEVGRLLDEGLSKGDDGWVDLPIRTGDAAGYVPSVTGPIMPTATLPSWENDARRVTTNKQPRPLWDHSAVQVRPGAAPRAMSSVVRRLCLNFGAAFGLAYLSGGVLLELVAWYWRDLTSGSSLGYTLNAVAAAGIVIALTLATPMLFLGIVRHSLRHAMLCWLKMAGLTFALGTALFCFNIWRIDPRQSAAEGVFHRSWFIGTEVATIRNVFEGAQLTPRGTYVTVGFSGTQPIWRPQQVWSWRSALALYGSWLAMLLVVTTTIHRDLFRDREVLSWYAWLGVVAGPGCLWAMLESFVADPSLTQRIMFDLGPIPLSIDGYGIACGFSSWIILFVVVSFITWRERDQRQPKRQRKNTTTGARLAALRQKAEAGS